MWSYGIIWENYRRDIKRVKLFSYVGGNQIQNEQSIYQFDSTV